MTEIDSAALRHALHDGNEIALLDVREQGEFGLCHLFHANNTPLSRIELEITRLVPRRGTRIVLTSAGMPGLCEAAAKVLRERGYGDIRICPDRPADWETAGFTLYSGINVPSKAFGEAVEHHYRTPSLHPLELRAMQDRGDDIVVLDSRTFAEYRNMNIPGGISVPGGELAYRVRDFVPHPDTTVIVNCAGRTRSILGAQSVINSGIPNRVLALENGTMGWHLAGLALEHGREDRYRDGIPESLAEAEAMRDRIAKDYGVSYIDRETLAAWRAESAERTLYLLDVRDPEEFRAGHLPGSRSAPGGQLVQATDFQIAVRSGRIVLIDDTGVRATMTAHWLVQLGFPDVYVLQDGLGPEDNLETGFGKASIDANAPGISPDALAGQIGRPDVFVLDLGESRAHRKAHIPGSRWAIRTRIADTGPALPAEGLIVLTSEDGTIAGLAVQEVNGLTGAEVRVLEGGTDAWVAQGLPCESDRSYPPDEACIDVYLRAYDRNTDVEARMQEYIDWEIALVDQISGDPDVNFRLGPNSDRG